MLQLKTKDLDCADKELLTLKQQNQELFQKIQQFEHELEVKINKHNQEIYRQKEFYTEQIKQLKEENIILSTPRIDESQMKAKEEEIVQLKKEIQTANEKSDRIIRDNQELQNINFGLKNEQESQKKQIQALEDEKYKMYKRLAIVEAKRDIMQKQMNNIQERMKGNNSLQERISENPFGVTNNQDIPTKSQSARLLPEKNENQNQTDNYKIYEQNEMENNFITNQTEFLFIKQTKRIFEALYKELMKLVMTAPSSLEGQESILNNKMKNVKKEEKKNSEQQNSQGKNVIRKVYSQDNIRKQTNQNVIQFTISAEKFSQFERKYNNTLAALTEFLENPNQQSVNMSNDKKMFSQTMGPTQKRVGSLINLTKTFQPKQLFACIIQKNNNQNDQNTPLQQTPQQKKLPLRPKTMLKSKSKENNQSRVSIEERNSYVLSSQQKRAGSLGPAKSPRESKQ